MSRIVLTLLGALMLLPASVGAQTLVNHFEAGGGYYAWSGENVDALEPGFRFQAIAGRDVNPSWLLAISGLYSLVGVEDTLLDGNEFGLGGKVRRSFGPGDGPRVHAHLYAGWSRLSVTLPSEAEFEDDGVALGPGVGFELPLNPAVSLVVSGEAVWHGYSDLGAAEEFGLGEEGDSGWRFGVQGGLAFGRRR